MITTIHKIRVELEGELIGIREVNFQMKMAGAKGLNRDTCDFSTYDKIEPGQKVKIVLVVGEKERKNIELFEGTVKVVNSTIVDDLVVRQVSCKA